MDISPEYLLLQSEHFLVGAVLSYCFVSLLFLSLFAVAECLIFHVQLLCLSKGFVITMLFACCLFIKHLYMQVAYNEMPSTEVRGYASILKKKKKEEALLHTVSTPLTIRVSI